VKIINLGNDSLLCVTKDDLYLVRSKKSKLSSVKLPYGSGTFKDAIYDNKNEFIFGTSSQLYKIANGNYKNLFNQRITTIAIDSRKTIWIGNLTGLYKLPVGLDTPIKIRIKNIKLGKINDISFNKGKVIIATDYGISIFNDSLKKIETIITEKNGLINNQCKKITLHKNSLWIATNSGISRIELEENGITIKKISSYSLSDGLVSNFINDILIKNDTVWAATNEGLSVFPCNIGNTIYNPIMNIIEAKSSLSSFNIHQPIKLTPEENNISITFSNMLFTKDNKIAYQYRILPIEEKWIEIQENSITFSNLNPNDYTFEVRPSGENIKNNKSVTLNFEVLPRFTQTLLFQSLLLLGVMIGRRKNFIEKTISQLELDAIKAQINPHFIYNCLTSIKNTIIKNDNLNAEEQLSVFAKLVRQTLSISQKNFITLDKEIEYLENYLEMEKIRFKEKLIYSINLSNISTASILQLPSMLVQPFVENAIKHGAPTNEKLPSIITINFSLKNNNLLCEIQDNGPGISNTNSISLHRSQGIQISSNRASTYNKLYDTNIVVNTDKIQEEGTLISISIPQKK
jgi:anti-sigma regulatory factor (Ser/Thr protein kinase)